MKRFLSIIALAGGLSFGGPAGIASSSEAVGDVFGLSDVDVSIAEGAFIDWYAPSDPSFETQREFISLIFLNGATRGGEAVLSGAEPVEMLITVTRFDILSTLELFFCCAANEIEAEFELRDPRTGDRVLGPEVLNFDHMGVGGLFGAIASSEGEDQLQRVMSLIEAGTAEWLSDPSRTIPATAAVE
ncbi:MAG: DUF6778 family protein [Pseudomonadota bacterium]